MAFAAKAFHSPQLTSVLFTDAHRWIFDIDSPLKTVMSTYCQTAREAQRFVKLHRIRPMLPNPTEPMFRATAATTLNIHFVEKNSIFSCESAFCEHRRLEQTSSGPSTDKPSQLTWADAAVAEERA
jgi:hypothetical protein